MLKAAMPRQFANQKMNSHLSIKINGKHLALPNDFSVDIDYHNPMFNDSESFSYPAEMPIEGNRFFLHNIEEKRSPLRSISFEDTKARIYADGIPVFDGKLKTSDDEDIVDNLSMNIEGGQTLNDLIADLDCRDIPIKDDILIGEKVSKVTVKAKGTALMRLRVACDQLDNGHISYIIKDHPINVEFTPQALGFSVPCKCTEDITELVPKSRYTAIPTGVDNYIQSIPEPLESYINVSEPYPYKPYCNAKVAYKHYGIDSDGKTSDSVVPSQPYWVLDADRPQSGLCFYVLYFLDCLFAHLGVEWDNSVLTQIEDFNRLCFYSTRCTYDEVQDGEEIEKSGIFAFNHINRWLITRGCGATIQLNFDTRNDITEVVIPKNTPFITEDGSSEKGYFLEETKLTADSVAWGVKTKDVPILYSRIKSGKDGPVGWSDYKYMVLKLYEIRDGMTQEWDTSQTKIEKVSVSFAKMYANAQNWPEESVSTILTSLENQFGIKFIYDAEGKKVTARLLRDMYRDQSAPREFLGTIYEMNKVAEKITGVRVCYASESGSKEKRDNLRDQKKDYDTSYDYIDYPDPDAKMGLSGMATARTTDITKTFEDICNNATNTDNTCYIDQKTGNAYRVKIDSEATTAAEMKPVWFEVGQFKGVEMGDCSEINEDYVIEFASSFEPINFSDVNSKAVQAAAGTDAINNKDFQPNLVAFCDEDMEHEYVKQYLDYPAKEVDINVTVRATTHFRENYDVSSSDDGNSPLQTYDWGLAIAIMRGGGSDASTSVFDANYDGFGNSKWKQTVANYAMTTDSIDHLCNHFDYNGTETGLMRGERFSLKIRAFKGEQTSWANGNPLCADDEYSTTDGWYYIKNRGTFDRFMFEHAHFILNRRKFLVKCALTPAFLMDIRNHWQERWRINGEIGYINKVSTSISVKEGIEQAEIEFYAI